MNPTDSAQPPHATKPLIIVAVTGGIAAYKAADLVSRLKKKSFEVQVVMTEAATHFVAPLTFSALSGRSALTQVFPSHAGERPEDAYPHLYPATRADVFVVAPATADIIAKLAHGLGSDIVSASALSLPDRCHRFFAPAMNVEMWNQAVVQQNVARLEALGWIRIGPDSGSLACGMTGEGRMSEPAMIAEHVSDAMDTGRLAASALRGRKVLILSGPTCEHIDPVRFISNASSGKMGKALAERAVAQGADVTFVTGPVSPANLPVASGIRMEHIASADDLLRAGQQHFDESDVVIYAAAVADYRPVNRTDEKLPKEKGTMSLELEATPDVAATLNQRKRPGQIAIGFALQTHDGERKALEKMKAKKFDGIVLNALDALGGDDGRYTFFDAATGSADAWGQLTKPACAKKILAFAADRAQ